MSYTKLFSSIVTSTIWTEDNPTRIVWITMMALADRNGEVHASIPGLARVAGVAVPECEAAIEKFLSPDPYSRTADDLGRRIETIDGGWHLLNHQKYREMERDDDRRIKAAERKRRQREREARNREKSRDVTHKSRDVPRESHQNPQAEAEAEAEAEDSLPTSENPPPNPQKKTRPEEADIPESFDAEAGAPPPDPQGGGRILPKGWKSMTATDRKSKRVNRNSPAMIQIGKWFRRSANTLWSVSEAARLLEIRPTKEEIHLLGFYYGADIDPDQDYRRKNLETLLNNWISEIDRANVWMIDNGYELPPMEDAA